MAARITKHRRRSAPCAGQWAGRAARAASSQPPAVRRGPESRVCSMEQPPRAVPCSSLYKPVKFCTAFVILTGLGLLLVYGLMQLTALSAPSPLQRAPPAMARTTSGPVEGLAQTSASGRRFYSFEGLPYAQPPLGPLRFKDPQIPPPTWENTFAAKSPREICLVVEKGAARGYVGAEDCLYLNVYTPQLEGDAPVMVWLGDGSFVFRDPAARRPRLGRLVDKGLVVVTVEYRRGVLGFLGTHDSGNYGLKDQVAALRWVRDNIAAFGGHPARVTLFGVGAGAASVGFHMLSPLSEGLFSRAIAMGGSPLNPWAFNHSPRHAAMIFSAALPTDSSWNYSHVAEDLRTLSVGDLVAGLPEAYQEWYPDVIQLFVPSIEPASSGAFMMDTPWSVLEHNLPNAVPFLTGSTSAEGKQLLKVARLAALQDNFLQLVHPALRRASETSWLRAAPLVRSFYFGDDSIGSAATEDVLNLLTDMFYLEGIDRMARSVAALSPYPVYYYHYRHERNNTQDDTGLSGAMHGEDAHAILYSPEDDRESDPDSEEAINDVWLSMLTDFAKTGEPSATVGVAWPPHTDDDPAYLEVGRELRARRDLLPARMDFWRSVLPRPAPPQL
ncbi:esterase E4-like [Schistocerca cancellata]|uniref:esterase E4-like n=1 Tax=Schistocerca cancellata TaxID=274614 RepID=UPI002119ADAA|nr:esterase E4-like [Schistocerca cancellata]